MKAFEGGETNSEGIFMMEPYESEYARFTKLHAQAKDFVKFLTTLERQFKSITQGDLVGIEETIPSLLNGLKLIFTISRHINAETTKMEKLLHSISNEICEKVANKINLKTIFKDPPNKSIATIQQGEKCLTKWMIKFQETKKEIEKENNGQNRWDFSTTGELFDRPKYMRNVLGNLSEACQILKDFFAILGPDLKAVTGDAEQIENLMGKVKDSTKDIVNFPNDVFDKTYETNWKTVFDEFRKSTKIGEERTCDLINNTFQHQLNSSEGAFDLLRNFKVIKTRDVIEQQLRDKYRDVINQYKKELLEMNELFNMHKDNPPISKNMPPTAGKIAWARSIMNRIKAPIFKFKTKEGMLTQGDGIPVTKSYINLSKQLDVEYEEKIFSAWNSKNTDYAIADLNQNILKSVDGKYQVSFSNRLKVIIREAKFLDRIGREIPQTIINIALQEKEYSYYVDKLN
jgi:dynein heavy chain